MSVQNETEVQAWQENGGIALQPVPRKVELVKCDLSVWPFLTFDELLGQYRKVSRPPHR